MILQPKLKIPLLIISIAIIGSLFYLSSSFFSTPNTTEPSLKNIFTKIKTKNLSPLDSYLYSNFSFVLNLGPEKEKIASIVCDSKVATTTKTGLKQAINCQNQNFIHKTLIGWVNVNEKNLDTLRWLGNNQLGFRSPQSNLEGTQHCVDNPKVVSAIKNAVAAGSCYMDLPNGEKVYSVAVFIQPSNVKARRFFVTVMNVSTSTSPEAVEKELMEILRNTDSKSLKKVSYGLIERANASGGGGGSSGGTCTATVTGNSCSSDGMSSDTCGCSDVATADNGGGADATMCSVSNPSSCVPVYCNSPTAIFNASLGMCTEIQIQINITP
jgi:hypothetical protein